MGSFFMPKIPVNLFFRVARMVAETGRIDRVRDDGLFESFLIVPF